jgi:hypothetical protein
MKGYRCIGPCLPSIKEVTIDTTQRMWSNPDTWLSGKVPKEDEDAII